MLRARRAVCFRASALLRRRLNCIRIDRSNPKPNRRQLPLPIDNESQGQGCRQTLTAPPLAAEKAKETGPNYKKGGAGRRQKTGTEKDGRKTPQAEAGLSAAMAQLSQAAQKLAQAAERLSAPSGLAAVAEARHEGAAPPRPADTASAQDPEAADAGQGG
jgi:hypothetical protein